jgi:hypothetical protein
VNEKRVMFAPPYDRRCDECKSIGGHAVHCSRCARSLADEGVPVRAQEAQPGEWVVSKGWTWFPGIYDSRDAAELAAVQYTDEQVEGMWARFDRPRPITLDDLWAFEKEQ